MTRTSPPTAATSGSALTGEEAPWQRALRARTWRQTHMTRLQPPFFSTGLPHLGQGFVCAVSQFFVSLSSWHFSRHSRHLERARVSGDPLEPNPL